MFFRKRQPAPPKAFYQELPTFPASDTEGILEALHVDGFALLPGVLGASIVSEAREAIDRLTPIQWDHTGLTDHYKNVFNRDPFWIKLLDPPGIIEVAEAALGARCHIIGQTAWRSHPGHRGVGLHLDYLPIDFAEKGPPKGLRVPLFLLTAHFYLTTITNDLCPTHVIPGSHQAGRRPALLDEHWNGRLPQPVLCEAGDVLLFRSDLWHSGSDNVSRDQSRYLLQVHYGRREMAQHFAPYLNWRFNRDVLAACSERQLRLLGNHPPGAYD